MKEVFIGSSTEALRYANALRDLLDSRFLAERLDYKCTVWNDAGVFPPGLNTIDCLLERAEKLRNNDGLALLLFTPDDKLKTLDNRAFYAPRDNITLECGLFIGALGKRRCCYLYPFHKKDSLKLASDLSGVTGIPFIHTNKRGIDLSSNLNEAVRKIIMHIKDLQRNP